MITDYLKFAFGTISHRKMRSWLTMIGIFIGIAAVVALISLGQGFKEAINREFEKIGTDKLFVTAKSGFGAPGTNAAVELAKDDMKVVKKRLLNIALEKLGIKFDTMMMKEQMTAVFSKGDLSSVAQIVHKFSKEIIKGKKGNFAVLGAFDASDGRVVDANEFKAIATLPSREVLLAQVAMMLTMPLKQMMMVLNEKSKKV